MSVKLVRPSGLIPVQDEWEALAQGLQQPHPHQPPGVPTTREQARLSQEQLCRNISTSSFPKLSFFSYQAHKFHIVIHSL